MHIRELNHVAIHIANVGRSVAFYGEILGFAAIPRPSFDFPGAWFRLGEKQELHLIGDRNQDVTSHPRGTHFALAVTSIEEVEQLLRSKGLTFSGPKKRPDGALQIFLQDPDGHYLEFCQLL
jgi:catechol 2,3-dioxygenase-like lactoylglutathione lyase family enzyme